MKAFLRKEYKPKNLNEPKQGIYTFWRQITAIGIYRQMIQLARCQISFMLFQIGWEHLQKKITDFGNYLWVELNLPEYSTNVAFFPCFFVKQLTDQITSKYCPGIVWFILNIKKKIYWKRSASKATVRRGTYWSWLWFFMCSRWRNHQTLHRCCCIVIWLLQNKIVMKFTTINSLSLQVAHRSIRKMVNNTAYRWVTWHKDMNRKVSWLVDAW